MPGHLHARADRSSSLASSHAAFGGPGRIYLAAATMLGWIVFLREVVVPLLVVRPVSQLVLVTKGVPPDHRIVLMWYLMFGGFFVIGVYLATPSVRRWRRKQRGLCVNCGYNVSSERRIAHRRCSECGHSTVA